MSHRLNILIALTNHLKTLTPDLGYTNDLSESVFRGRTLFGANITNRPLVSIIEAPRPDFSVYTGEGQDFRRDVWTLLIQGLAEDDALNPTDPAYHLAYEVEQHLFRLIEVRSQTGAPRYPDIHLLGGLITSMEVAAPVVRPPEQNVSTSAFFFLPVRLGVAVEAGRPYT